MDIKSVNTTLKVQEKFEKAPLFVDNNKEDKKSNISFNSDSNSVSNVLSKDFTQIFKIPETTNSNVVSTNKISTKYDSRIFPNGVKGINPSDIQQNQIGDCYFLSSLASLAKQRPQDIIKMIKDNGDGTCNVKFPGRSGAIKVKIPTDDEINKSSGAGKGDNGSIWVAILEKAYIQDHTFGKKQVELSGMNIRKGISDVTGNSTDIDTITRFSIDSIKDKIENKISQGKIIVASTFGYGDASKNISSKHVYSVLGYDRNTDLITVRNPWGASGEPNGIKNNDGVSDGVFKLTPQEFNNLFSLICYEE
ncbi:MAG: C2 family cysteine protease [Candidatus Sericytochromatia bacterium]